jgi:predicted dehydrogenase
LTTNLFARSIQGANDRLTVGFIGMGAMGSGNLGYAMRVPGIQPVAVCDVYQPNLEKAQAAALRGGHQVKAVKDFREIIADKSIDAVCISTPDHWHAYMTVEACKAGKDVFVEKPACVYIEEGQKMVQAARKYQRIVQAGTMQRSGGYFKKAAEMVQNGDAGDITFVHTWQASLSKPEGVGNPTDETIPAGLDWDLWLGPAPKVPFNVNRWGIVPGRWSTFRNFWDYAGGALTDWGVHLLDPVHQCMGEPMPTSVVALGDRYLLKDNTETPDTLMVTWHYPKFIATYESRLFNPTPMFGQGGATALHGTKGTIVVNRSGCWFSPTPASGLAAVAYEKNDEMRDLNVPHWKNFLECVRTRQKPISEIETCVRSSSACILGNLALRLNMRLDWDEKQWTTLQEAAKPHLKARYRSPWKLEV